MLLHHKNTTTGGGVPPPQLIPQTSGDKPQSTGCSAISNQLRPVWQALALDENRRPEIIIPDKSENQHKARQSLAGSRAEQVSENCEFRRPVNAGRFK